MLYSGPGGLGELPGSLFCFHFLLLGYWTMALESILGTRYEALDQSVCARATQLQASTTQLCSNLFSTNSPPFISSLPFSMLYKKETNPLPSSPPTPVLPPPISSPNIHPLCRPSLIPGSNWHLLRLPPRLLLHRLEFSQYACHRNDATGISGRCAGLLGWTG